MRRRVELASEEISRRHQALFVLALVAWCAGMCALSLAATVVVEVLHRPGPGPVSVTVAAGDAGDAGDAW
ncbi:hypothetical protein E0F15_08855 [Frankia sp. B2]|uniref:hypothetical protein n=1 Tax=Frankia TaxID=1854 RepID=UPI0003D0595B|nr:MULTISPECIES: hypothetical protein [Frankia]ETA04228.1 hypothetical protein CcI6DRAFT_00444 [Frankia sp. CcI6]KDA44554.1 hypothetical protein BMG523Draft_00403 [Frankia sp. BMG5.23]KFB05557.1 hypothetical protein ALLO2DRAFT_01508 [Frankia sp. Allo2]OAA27670.1 hypothetical protein AAY23_102283 [Frankia casuarinae]TFE32146.1 hypothetical protein E0F15_08855 [Frankia sp. B2]